VLVVGAGRLGQFVAQTLRLIGCKLSVVARYQEQRQLVEEWGIDVLEESQIPQGTMDIVVDTTGSPGGFQAASSAVRNRGVFVLKSTYAGLLEFDTSALVVDKITLIGSRCEPFAPALQLLREQVVNPEPLISTSFPIESGLKAFEKAGEKGVLKVLLLN
jgi:threonine dehydrogenase-like Zn-dependent dehydrogenase